MRAEDARPPPFPHLPPNPVPASARVHDGLRELQTGAELYRTVLQYDAGCVEAVACLAAHHFYCDQPEVALRFYRRLLQCGVSSPELWSNLVRARSGGPPPRRVARSAPSPLQRSTPWCGCSYSAAAC